MLVTASHVHPPSGTQRHDTELRKLLYSAGSSAGAGTASPSLRRPGSGLCPGNCNRVRQQRVSVSCLLHHRTGLTVHLREPVAAGSTHPQAAWVLAARPLLRGPHPDSAGPSVELRDTCHSQAPPSLHDGNRAAAAWVSGKLL